MTLSCSPDHLRRMLPSKPASAQQAAACAVRACAAANALPHNRRCINSVRPSTRTAAVAVASDAPSVLQLGDGCSFFAPPMTENPTELLQQRVPFLTRDSGTVPEQPTSLYHALRLYGSYTSKYVSVRVRNVHVKLQSWEHAVDALAEAEERRQPYWCSLLEDVQHPSWWPTRGKVPQYDQVIFGRGNASIGLHFDKDNACAGGSRRPVSTYLAISSGVKLVLLLPPDQTLLQPEACQDASMLLQPSPGMLDRVRAAGGYYFLLEHRPNAGCSPPSEATTLYMPAGWYHWVVGLTDWHVVFGGSFYPEEQ